MTATTTETTTINHFINGAETAGEGDRTTSCLLYTSPSPRDS